VIQLINFISGMRTIILVYFPVQSVQFPLIGPNHVERPFVLTERHW